MGIFNKIRGGAGQSGYPSKPTQFNNGGMSRPSAPAPAPSAPAPRSYEKDSRGLNKMPNVESLGAPKSGMTFHNTPKGSSSPLRHEVTSYGDMHTVNTYGQTAKGEARLGSFMTDQAPAFENGSLRFGGGNTFDMATGEQFPSGASHENAKMTREWKN
jgi:hypothetical protein